MPATIEKPDVDKKETETTPEAPKADERFDKERQRADQAEANFRKERKERETLSGELTSLRETAARLQTQIADLTTTKKAKDELSDLLPELPDDAGVEDLAAALKATTKIVKNLHTELTSLKSTTAKHERETAAEREERLATERRNATLEKVCTRLEKKYGAGLRNRAIALMEARIDKGDKPDDPADAALMLDECFAEAKTDREKDKSKGKDDKPTDTGGGGSRPTLGPAKIKAGSLDEVAAQFESAGTG